jgi:endo-alpha-1,4-polygalactosaminidase (GH114 family)
MALGARDIGFLYQGPQFNVSDLASAPHQTLVLGRSRDFSAPGDADFTQAELAQMRSGQPGRDVILYMSVAEIIDTQDVFGQLTGVATRPHWDPLYTSTRMVDFTDPDWLTFLKEKWLPRLIDQNNDNIADADGLFLDTIDDYRAFGTTYWTELGNQQQLADAMILLLANFTAYAKQYAAARGEPDFKVFLGHGPQLYNHSSKSPGVEAAMQVLRANTDAMLLEGQHVGRYQNGQPIIEPFNIFAAQNVAQAQQDFGQYGIDLVSMSTFGDAGLATAFNSAMLSQGLFPVARPTDGLNVLNSVSNRATGGADALLASHSGSTIFGLGGADTILGGNGVDNLYGGAGGDALRGGGGTDVLFGEAGNDTIEGGAGVDLVLGGDGDDSLLGGASSDTLLGELGLDRLEGEDGNDVLWGGGGGDLVLGGAGLDYLYGQDGADTLLGGLDVNVYIGGDGDDVMSSGLGLSGTLATQIFYGESGANLLAGGPVGNDSATGGAATDWFIMEAGNDTMIGGAGSDMFYGGDGNDLIDMREGAGAAASGDYAWGHAGADTFLTQTGQASVEVIMDFQAGPGAGDVVRILGSNYSSFTQLFNASVESNGYLIVPMSGGSEAVYLWGVTKAQLAADDFILG